MPTLPGIPPRRHAAAWAHTKDMFVELIHEKCHGAEEETMRTGAMDTDDSKFGDWLSHAATASVKKTSAEIADDEIWLCRAHTAGTSACS